MTQTVIPSEAIPETKPETKPETPGIVYGKLALENRGLSELVDFDPLICALFAAIVIVNGRADSRGNSGGEIFQLESELADELQKIWLKAKLSVARRIMAGNRP